MNHHAMAALAAATLVACGPAPGAPPGPPSPPTAMPPTSGPPTTTASNACPVDAPIVPLGQKTARQEPKTLAGQMTEEHAQAKRLFDSQRWADAELLLKRVADGQTGDDLGNREIAHYHLAVAQYQQGKRPQAHTTFDVFARDEEHNKHGATLPWLVRLYLDDGHAPALDSLAFYIDELSALCPISEPACDQQIFALGLAAYRVGNFKRAVYFFREVPQSSPHHADAASCLAASEQR